MPENNASISSGEQSQAGYRIGGFCHRNDFSGDSTPTQSCVDNPAIGLTCPTTPSTQYVNLLHAVPESQRITNII